MNKLFLRFSKSIFATLLLVFTMLFSLSSCSKDEEEAVYVDYTTASVAASATSYKISIFSTGVTWTLTQDSYSKGWASINGESSGDSDTQVEIKLQPNQSLTSRTATFTLSYNIDGDETSNIEITQEALTNVINLASDTLFLKCDAVEASILVESKFEWKETFSDSWISNPQVTDVDSLDNTKLLTFALEPNTNVGFRVAEISLDVVEGGYESKYYIFQNGSGSLQSDSLALVDIYATMGGASWTNKWDLTQPIESWRGVTVKQTYSGDRVVALELPNNNLEGPFSSQICNLSFLEVLALQQNAITDTIPSDLGRLYNMVFLYLYENNLSGVIPTTLPLLTNLQRLHLHHNGLTGVIPELGSLKKLAVLGLNDNLLSGTLPEGVGELSFLRYLSVNNNNLSSPIPNSYFVNSYWYDWEPEINIFPQLDGKFIELEVK